MTWLDDEPVRGGYFTPDLLQLPGLERMRLALHGEAPPPPIHHLLGLRPVSVNPAGVTFTMPATRRLQTGAGVFGAGTSALVADAALGGAIAVALPPGRVLTTSDLSLNFLRPVTVSSGQLTARGRLINLGNRLALAEALVEDAEGRVVAHSTTRCFLFDIDALPGERPASNTASRGDRRARSTADDGPDPYERPPGTTPVPAAVWADTPFTEIIERVKAGHLPKAPVIELFGVEQEGVAEGFFACRMPASEWFCHSGRYLYGGIIALLADLVVTGAMSTTVGPTAICTPLDLKVSYLRPVPPDGRAVVAEGRVVHRGRSYLVAQAELCNAEGKVVALAASSGVVVEGRSWAEFAAADELPVAEEAPADDATT